MFLMLFRRKKTKCRYSNGAGRRKHKIDFCHEKTWNFKKDVWAFFQVQILFTQSAAQVILKENKNLVRNMGAM